MSGLLQFGSLRGVAPHRIGLHELASLHTGTVTSTDQPYGGTYEHLPGSLCVYILPAIAAFSHIATPRATDAPDNR